MSEQWDEDVGGVEDDHPDGPGDEGGCDDGFDEEEDEDLDAYEWDDEEDE